MPDDSSSDPQVPGKTAEAPARPPGEIGGHTVQPWEQAPAGGATGMERIPTSKDVPPPQAGAAEAKVAGPGPGLVTTPAPGNIPSREGPHGSGPADAGAAVAAQAATPPAMTRPPRPPVYSPQQGHEPAPRPPPSHQTGGQATDGDRLVEAITKAIAENIGKAFHQSVAQAVREVFPLSGKSVDQGVPAPAPAFTQASTAAGTAGGKVPQPAKGAVRRSDAGTGQHGPPPSAARDTAAPESPGPSGSHPTGKEPTFQAGAAPDGRTGPTTSQYGGTIEPPVPVPADKSPPGNAAAASADEESRKGNLA